ncbi:MAG TPA: SDR family NAD(P)-dependent oxidoreductase, partial [Novosphingobium sp.]|nr:SDR family NAD(P)-dependent oxidoreductase [Novosphingobium sp.]
MPRLMGKTCVVTGAARGIGRAICETFVREGAEVILTDIDRTAG